MKFLQRYFDKILPKLSSSQTKLPPQQWTRDIMQLMVLLSIPGAILTIFFILLNVINFGDVFPIFVLFILVIPFWFFSKSKLWKFAQPFPAFSCFAIGAYGIYHLGMHFNLSFYLALAVLVAGLLQGIYFSLLYVFMGTAATVLFGVLFTIQPLDFDLTTSITMSTMITFFCLLGVFLVQWYLKSRLEYLISIEVINNNSLKDEIELRHQAEIARDIQEEQLKLSEEKFSKAFLISPDSVNINRLADGVFLDINQGFTKIMGYTRDEVLGKSSLELNIWADPADRSRLVTGLLETGEVSNLETKFIRKWGEISVGLMSARVLEINGEKCILSITRDITERKRQEVELRKAHTNLELAYDATLQGWVKALEMREKETANHSRRVVDLTLQLAALFQVEPGQMIHIQRGALLHDIGKIGVPDVILLKPGPLDQREWKIMRMHPVLAHSLLNRIDYLHPAIDIPYCHHEKWDGSGYPRGLKGEEIPLSARIFAVVDVYDALTSPRPYRPAWSEKKALEYILDQSGRHFDPAIVEPFMNIDKSLEPAGGEHLRS